MLLFAVGFICLVAGVVLYLLAEDNGYKKLSKKVDEYNSRMERIEKEYAGINHRLSGLSSVITTCQTVNGSLVNRVQMLELKIDVVRTPNLKFDQKPLQVIHRQGPPVKKKSPEVTQ